MAALRDFKLTDGVATAKRQDDRLDGESDGEEVLRARVLLFQVDNFGPAAVGEVTGKLQVDAESSGRHEESDHPIEKCETN